MEIKVEISLLELMIKYLESEGWYFDWEHANQLTWYDSDGERLREAHAWTVPQWDEYWVKPYSDDPTHKNFGAPKNRRYENLQTAVWSQVLREEEPETYKVFYSEENPA